MARQSSRGSTFHVQSSNVSGRAAGASEDSGKSCAWEADLRVRVTTIVLVHGPGPGWRSSRRSRRARSSVCPSVRVSVWPATRERTWRRRAGVIVVMPPVSTGVRTDVRVRVSNVRRRNADARRQCRRRRRDPGARLRHRCRGLCQSPCAPWRAHDADTAGCSGIYSTGHRAAGTGKVKHPAEKDREEIPRESRSSERPRRADQSRCTARQPWSKRGLRR